MSRWFTTVIVASLCSASAFALTAPPASASSASIASVSVQAANFAAGVASSPNTGTFAAVSCTSDSSCTGVGSFFDVNGNQEAFTQTENFGSWSTATPVSFASGVQNASPNDALTAISCSDASDCTAAGKFKDQNGNYQAFTVTENAGVWGNARPAVFASGVDNSAPLDIYNAISCSSVGNCTAAGSFRDSNGNSEAFTESQTGGLWGQATPATFGSGIDNATPSDQFTSISCPSDGNCVAAGDFIDANGNQEAMTESKNSGAWQTAVPAIFASGVDNASPEDLFTSISCSSNTNCTAAGQFKDANGNREAFTESESYGYWYSAMPAQFASGVASVTAPAAFTDISCPSDGNCVAVGYFGDSFGDPEAFREEEVNGSWITSVPAHFANGVEAAVPAASFTSVSCISTGNCVATGQFASALNSSGTQVPFTQAEVNGAWSTAQAVVLPSNLTNPNPQDGFTAISCASNGTCVAVGNVQGSSGDAEPVSDLLTQVLPSQTFGIPSSQTAFNLAMVSDGGFVFELMPNGYFSQLFKFTESGDLLATYALPVNDGSDMVADGTHLWIADRTNNDVLEVDESSGSVVQTLDNVVYGFSSPDKLYSDGTNLFVMNAHSNAITLLSESSGQYLDSLSMGLDQPTSIVQSNGKLYITNQGSNSIAVYAALGSSYISTGTYGSSDGIALNQPSASYAYNGKVWICNSGTGAITEIQTSPNAAPTQTQILSGSDVYCDAITGSGTNLFQIIYTSGSDQVVEINGDTGELLAADVLPNNEAVAGQAFILNKAIWVPVTDHSAKGGYATYDVSSGDLGSNFVTGYAGSPPEYDIVPAYGELWAIDSQDDQVNELDPTTGTVIASVDHGQGADSVTACGGSIWITNGFGNSVTEVDPGDVRNSLTLNSSNYQLNDPGPAACANDSLWVPGSDNSVIVIPTTNVANPTILSDSSFGFDHPLAIFAAGNSVVVTNDDGSATQIDAVTETETATYPSIGQIYQATSVGSSLWYITEGGMGEIDTASATSVLSGIGGGGMYTGITNDGSDVFVSGYTGLSAYGDIFEFNASGGSLESTMNSTFYGLEYAGSLAYNNGTLYVSDYGSNEISAIDVASPPLAPVNVSAVSSDSSVIVSWSAPSFNGMAISDYQVTATVLNGCGVNSRKIALRTCDVRRDGASASLETQVCTTLTTSCTLTGLTNGSYYIFSVTAIGPAGSSPPSYSNTLNPHGAPSQPENLVAWAGNHQLLVSWNPPASDGGRAIDHYVVTLSTGATCSTATTSCLFQSLTNGTAEVASIQAVNTTRDSSPVEFAPSVTPAGEPGMPTISSLSVATDPATATSSATLNWNAINDNGSAITGDTVAYTAGSSDVWHYATGCVTPSTSCEITDLTPGTTYYFEVAASNAMGTGPQSPLISATTPALSSHFTITASPAAILKGHSETLNVSGAGASSAVTVSLLGATKTCHTSAMGTCQVTLSPSSGYGLATATYSSGGQSHQAQTTSAVSVLGITTPSKVNRNASFKIALSGLKPSSSGSVSWNAKTLHFTANAHGQSTVTFHAPSKKVSAVVTVTDLGVRITGPKVGVSK